MRILFELIGGEAGKELNKFIFENNIEFFYFRFSLVIITISLIISLINWLYFNMKISSEIEKNKVESKERYWGLLEKVESLRTDYLKSSEHLQNSIRVMIVDLSKPVNTEYWNETANIFYNEFLKSFNKYLIFKRQLLQMDRRDALYYIDDEMFKYLDTIFFIADTMNSDEISKIYPETKLIISMESTKPVFRLIKDFIRFYNFGRMWKYLKYYNKMKVYASLYSY